jgi:uridine phosphorylase
MCYVFFGEVVEKFSKLPGVRIVGTTKWETGNANIYAMQYKGVDVAFFHTWVGAPIAAGVMEFVIAYGGKKFIVRGGCGVLDSSIAAGYIIIPTAAVRDEGTS